MRAVSVTKERLWAVSLLREGPMFTSDLIRKGVSRDVLDGLVRHRVLKTVKSDSDGFVGRPENIYLISDESPLRRSPRVKSRKSPLQDKILQIVGDNEMTGREIAINVGQPHENISTTLGNMCASGKLVRRRQQGALRGRTQVREFYIYRRA